MKKDKTAFHRLKLFTGITLCFIMTSCNGQANNGDKQNVIKEEKTFQFPNFNRFLNVSAWFNTMGFSDPLMTIL